MTFVRLTACIALALTWAPPLRAQLASAEEAIRAEVHEFYRDDRADRWPDVLGHFWVGKITARWTAPTSDPAWVHAHPAPRDSVCARKQGQGGEGQLATTIAVIDDRWARVFVSRCVGAPDELWMLRVGEQWRIARMIRGS